MKTIILAGAAVAALVSAAASAQPADQDRARPALTRDAVVARVDARFARLDADRNGVVTQDEVRARAEARRERRGEQRGERRAQRQERRGELFARLDADRDGSLSRAEFEARPKLGREQRAERREGRGERRAERRGRRGGHGGFIAHLGLRPFQAADADRDGRVTRAEARQSALATFDRVDTNRDGTISREERREARETLGGPRRQHRRG